VLHTALRAKADAIVNVNGQNVIPEIYEVKEKMKSFSSLVISGMKKGYSLVNSLPILLYRNWGSDLRPMAVEFYSIIVTIYRCILFRM
jgi:glucose-6-phosphate isomerase